MNVATTKFSSLLKVRQHQEKQTQQELAAIRVKKEHEERQLNQLQQKREDAFNGETFSEKITAKEIQNSRAFIKTLNTLIDKKSNDIEVISTTETTKIEELVDRTIKKKMVENLDTKQREIFRREQERKEAKMIDILAQRLKMGLD